MPGETRRLKNENGKNTLWSQNGLRSYRSFSRAFLIIFTKLHQHDGPAQRRGGLGNGKTANTIEFCAEQIPSMKQVIFTQIHSIQPIIDTFCADSPFENNHVDAMSSNRRLLKTLVWIQKHARFVLLPWVKPVELCLQSRAPQSLGQAMSSAC